ncbi:YihY/virulence factor BrkB family protein [Halomarina ordinaria]|uniref:YhjD/YihY/BrkB family envelope integrity protein n=1 Tax=Halomarina ordinaria TaxID=3033939 RepID=A0ABD5UCX9_9EURY|nr:YihY/virulence factor BrkB family protein [Halomarina sp. PSRA2]
MSQAAPRAISITKGVVEGVQSERITFIAASIAYYAFISLIPLLLFGVLVATVVGGEQFAQEMAAIAVDQLGSETAGEQVESILSNQAGAGGATVLGTVALLWSALKLFRGLDIGFSEAYRAPGPEGLLQQVRNGLVTLVAVLLGIGFTVGVGTLLALPQFDLVVAGVDLLGMLGTLLLLVGLTLTFLPLYYFLPSSTVTLADALPGAMFAAVGWTVLQTGFRYYAEAAGASNELYGAIAGVLLLVTWMYFGALILLVGVVLNAVLAGRIEADEDDDGTGDESETQTTSPSLMADEDFDRLETELDDEELKAEVRRLREQVASFEQDIEERTVHRDDIERDLKRYVRGRMRRGKARGWGPYLVLLYGTAMTLGAFWLLDSGAWAVAAMLVIWLSTLGLYVVFVAVGLGFNLVGVPGRLRDRVQQFRS